MLELLKENGLYNENVVIDEDLKDRMRNSLKELWDVLVEWNARLAEQVGDETDVRESLFKDFASVAVDILEEDYFVEEE